MFLFQILVPLTISKRKSRAADAKKTLTRIERELAKKFGGVTAYTQSPAEGLWKQSKSITYDTVVAVEVMSKNRSLRWWKKYQRELEERLRQDEILIRYSEIETV